MRGQEEKSLYEDGKGEEEEGREEGRREGRRKKRECGKGGVEWMRGGVCGMSDGKAEA